MKKRTLSPDEVFDHAVAFHAKAVGEGKSVAAQYPKLKDVARHYGVRQEEVEDLVEEGSSKGYLGLIVGFGGQLGHGYIEKPEDRMIEAY